MNNLRAARTGWAGLFFERIVPLFGHYRQAL